MSNLEYNFLNHGYCEGPVVVDQNKIKELRDKLENSFKLKNFPRTISLFDIEDKNLITDILNIYLNKKITNFILELNKSVKETICILPRFIIHRNYHVDRVKSPGIGWHRDCGGELEYEYCKKNLSSKSYFFAKLGIYLQNNTEYGGSIDVIPDSHKYIKFKKLFFLRKLNGLKLNLLIKLQKYFPYFYKLISEKIYMKILNGRTLNPMIGSFVLFDSRIVHRGTPISDKLRDEINFDSLNYSAQGLPLEKVKFSIYVDLGNALALDSYLYDRNRRTNREAKEIDVLNLELKKLETFFPILANEIKEAFLPILRKYS